MSEAKVMTVAEIQQEQGISITDPTVTWYIEQGKVTKEDDKYTCNCLVCRQHFKNYEINTLIAIAENCRMSHVHDKGVTF